VTPQPLSDVTLLLYRGVVTELPETKFTGAQVLELLDEIDRLRTLGDSIANGKSQSELYESSSLFKHVWYCPLGWMDDKLLWPRGTTEKDVIAWLIELRRMVGFEHPEGIRSPDQPS